MAIKEIFSVLAGLLLIAGYIPYINAILRKETIPARATWLIWAGLDFIILAAMHAKGALNCQILAACVGASAVSLLSFKYGASGWARLDKITIAGAILGVVLWGISENPIWGIVISLIVMFAGSIPTFVSAWEDPNHENKAAWIIFFVSCICAVIAIPKWTFEDASQPITFLIIEIVMLYIIFRHSGVRSVESEKRIAVKIAEGM